MQIKQAVSYFIQQPWLPFASLWTKLVPLSCAAVVHHMFDTSDLSLCNHNTAEKRIGSCIRVADAIPHQRDYSDPFMIQDSDFWLKRYTNTLSLSSCLSTCIHMISPPPPNDHTAFLTRQKICWVENSRGDGWSVSWAELMWLGVNNPTKSDEGEELTNKKQYEVQVQNKLTVYPKLYFLSFRTMIHWPFTMVTHLTVR